MGINYTKNDIEPRGHRPSVQIPQGLEDLLGRGLAAPVLIFNNSWGTVKGLDKVKQNMYVTIATPVGRHFRNPDFGSLIPYMVFAQLTTKLADEIRVQVKKAIEVWLPYVLLSTVEVTSTEDNLVNIGIRFRVKGSSELESVVIYLANPDTTQIDPNVFSINSRSFFRSVVNG